MPYIQEFFSDKVVIIYSERIKIKQLIEDFSEDIELIYADTGKPALQLV